jgi:DNA-directed RNA polymerase sigma subunit (sigma70/sigma32)
MHNQREYKHKQAVDKIFCELEQTVGRGTYEHTFLEELYKKLLPEIQSVARRYLKLDRTLELGDFVDEGYLAVYDALLQYERDRGQKFSTYAYWHIQKRFENLCCKDKVVVLKNGYNSSVMSYKEFQKIKRSLPEGTEWTVESRLIPFEPFQNTNGDPNRMSM